MTPSERFVKKCCRITSISKSNAAGNSKGELALRPDLTLSQDVAGCRKKIALRLSFRPHSRLSGRGPGGQANPRVKGQRNDNVCLVIVAAHFNPDGGPGSRCATWIHRVASSLTPQQPRWGTPGVEPCSHRTTWSTFSYIIRHPCNDHATLGAEKPAHPQASVRLKISAGQASPNPCEAAFLIWMIRDQPRLKSGDLG